MAAAVGTLQTGTGTSDIVVSGLSFQPTAVLFWWNGQSSGTDANGSSDLQVGFGVAAGASDQFALSNWMSDAVTTTVTAFVQDVTNCIASVSSSDTVDGLAALSTFASDGFTLTVSDAFPVDMRVHYLAIDPTNAETVSFDPAATGNLDVATSFAPECILFANAGSALTSTNDAALAGLGIGMATGPSAEWAWTYRARDNRTVTGHPVSYSSGDECSNVVTNSAPTQRIQLIDLVPAAGDGFTVDVIEDDGRGVLCLVMAGGQFWVGDILSATDTNANAITSPGFYPEAVMLTSLCRAEHTSDTATNDGIKLSIGAGTGPASEVCHAISYDDQTTTEGWHAVEYDAIYVRGDFADGIEGSAELTSLGSSGFTFTHTDADPDAAFIGGFAYAETGYVGPGGSSFAHIRRRRAYK